MSSSHDREDKRSNNKIQEKKKDKYDICLNSKNQLTYPLSMLNIKDFCIIQNYGVPPKQDRTDMQDRTTRLVIVTAQLKLNSSWEWQSS